MDVATGAAPHAVSVDREAQNRGLHVIVARTPRIAAKKAGSAPVSKTPWLERAAS